MCINYKALETVQYFFSVSIPQSLCHFSKLSPTGIHYCKKVKGDFDIAFGLSLLSNLECTHT